MAEWYLLNAASLQEYLPQAMSLLSQEEQNRISQIHIQKQRLLSLAARILLYHVGKTYGITDFHMTYGKYGKPTLSAVSNFQFNLSHSGKYAVLACSTLPVGVDVEQVRERMPKHLEKILSPEEQIYLKQQNNDLKIFTKIWTRKESFVKWKGERIFDTPNQWNMVDDFDLAEELPDMGCRFCEYVLENHIITLCISVSDQVPQKLHILHGKDIFS